MLKKEWFDIGLVSLVILKPLNEKSLIAILKWTKYVYSLEEHSEIWWLWSIISNLITKHDLSIKLHKLAIKDEFPQVIWNQEYMRSISKLDSHSIYNTIKSNSK